MKKYLLKRLLSAVPVLFIVSIVIFLIIHITPGNPAAVILGQEATKEQIVELEESLGLNLPLYEQYLSWVSGVIRGDFGNSIFMKEPVTKSIASHLPPTLSLAIFAQLIALLIAIPLGTIAASRRGSFIDTFMMIVALLGMSIPSFLLALFLILFFGVKLGWLPVAGYKDLGYGFITHLRYLVLPAIALGSIQAALIARMTRSSMLEVLNLNYIKSARAKGVKRFALIYKHAFRNALLPILTVVGQTFGTLITGAVVTETIFNIPGLGQLIINSVERRDFAVIQGVVLFITVLFVFLNLIIDILYGVIDPRVRLDRK